MTLDPFYKPTYSDPFLPTQEPADLTSEEAAYSRLVEALREVQEAVTGARPSTTNADNIAAQLTDIATQLQPLVEEEDQLSGRLWTEAGRGQSLAPPLHIEEVLENSARGRVTFGRFHGGTMTAHGGVIPLVYDEIMGRLATAGTRPFARTAYLNVDYRAGVPLDTDIEVSASIESVEGRKLFLRGQMLLDGTVLTECTGLWVRIKQRGA